MASKLPKIKLHPQTIKSLRSGHPWITTDSFSKLFPKDRFLIDIFDSSGNFIGQFLNDFRHPKIKARFWSDKRLPFYPELKNRILKAVEKRKPFLEKRENIYLCFGEADGVPGLFIQQIGSVLLVQYNAYCWEEKLKFICHLFENSFTSILTQKRVTGEVKNSPVVYLGNNGPEVIQENKIKFKLVFNKGYDIGLYTDMASIREELTPLFTDSKKLLNLFSYTGAFSLLGLSKGMKVTSVDISKFYMDWLEENIKINQFRLENHTSIISPCDKALKKIEGKFDLIICDPPSFSSNGKKSETAMAFYKKNLLLMAEKLNKDGHLIIFLNTHGISKEKFLPTIKQILPNNKIIKHLNPSQDCPILEGFPEGDYLKGIIIK